MALKKNPGKVTDLDVVAKKSLRRKAKPAWPTITTATAGTTVTYFKTTATGGGGTNTWGVNYRG